MHHLRFSHHLIAEDEKQHIALCFADYDREHNVAYHPEIPLSALAYDGDSLVGAAVGRIWANWLYISDLWVEEVCRRQGLATRLLADLEAQAKQHHAVGSHTWTASYNAPGFYEKQGYEQALELRNKPRGHSSFIYRKYFTGGRAVFPLDSSPSNP